MSWTTAGLMLGAMGLSTVDLTEPQSPATPVSNDLIVLASASSEEAPKSASPLPESIPLARLETVTFTATGDSTDDLYRRSRSGPLGVVTGRSVNLRGGPGTNHAVVSRAVYDDQLPVTGVTDGAWVQVELALTGEPAWIHGKFFKAPEPAVIAQN
ncbi:MAG: SH3 domain-containing protein [Pseudomonadota bacterium]